MPEPISENSDLSTEEQTYQQTYEKLVSSLIKKRNEAIAFRAASGIERRWREDEKLVEGSLDYPNQYADMMSYATGEAPVHMTDQPVRSMIEINIVRNKCETAMGRFIDIILPVDAKNWGLKVTPVPELEKALKDERIAKLKGQDQPLKTPDGKEIKVADIAKNDLAQAKERMKLMELEIDDQLTECNYNGEIRKVIKNSIYAGTGIIRGPNVVKRTHKIYKKVPTEQGETYQLTVVEKHQPASEFVSNWNIYPNPDTTENVKKTMGWVFERQDIRANELYDLIGIKGYKENQIKAVLEEKPKKCEPHLIEKTDKYRTYQRVLENSELYEMWIYYGDLSTEDLKALDIDLSTSPEAYLLSACVVMVNDRLIKIMLNTLDSGDLPYDFFQWSPVLGSPWGIGLPRMMMWLQHMINGAMRAMMDNAGDSAGVNVIISNEISPADDKYELTGKKLWQYTGADPEEIDVRKLFAQFQVQNNQAELQNIIELAFKLLDLETGVPMIFQGEQQKLPETLGATNIMVDANNVSLRSRVKFFDDDITKPHLTKYYHWNMQYSKNQDIKGDFNVDPRGTSALLQRDQNLKTLLQALEYKNDPDFAARVDYDKAIQRLFDLLGLDILNPDNVYAERKKGQQKNPPKDPRIVTAELKAKADAEEQKLKMELAKAEFEFKKQEHQAKHKMALELKMIDRDIQMMRLAEESKISLEQIKTSLAKESMKLETQIALTDKNGKAPQITKPSVEPPGRAPDGEAFTK